MRFLMFTGQGSQFVGMGRDLYEKFEVVKSVFKEANDVLGFNLVELMFNGPDSALTLTKNAQPAILTVSIAIYELMKKETNFDFDVSAGHSLGEYSALVASGSLSFGEAVFAVYKRGEFMQEAVPEGVGAMAAILTDKHREIEELCKQVTDSVKDGYCQIANYNASKQIIVSGYKKGVDKVCELAKEKKLGRVIPLSVSAPFHCALMEPVKEKMSKVLENISFSTPNKKVIENTKSDVISTVEDIKRYLIDQITEPVRWVDNVNKAIEFGCNEFVEFGPKNVLSSMLKRELKRANIDYVVDLESYNSYKDKV